MSRLMIPAPWPSGKAADCKSAIRRFDSDRRLCGVLERAPCRGPFACGGILISGVSHHLSATLTRPTAGSQRMTVSVLVPDGSAGELSPPST